MKSQQGPALLDTVLHGLPVKATSSLSCSFLPALLVGNVLSSCKAVDQISCKHHTCKSATTLHAVLFVMALGQLTAVTVLCKRIRILIVQQQCSPAATLSQPQF